MPHDLSPFRPRNFDQHPKPLTPAYRSTQLRAPSYELLCFNATATEMTGPLFGHNVLSPLDDDLIVNYAQADQTAIGERILVHGTVMDENACPVPNALLEIWQANAGGRYRHQKDGYLAALDPNFGGCGRVLTGSDGCYSFKTIKPGPYPWPNGGNDWRPAHIHFSLFGAGLAQRLVTQMYFEGDPHIALCPIAATAPDKSQLIADLDMDKTVPVDLRAYRFDIVLRGRNQTTFAR